MKFGAKDLRDVLERASARESAARVAAGAVCKLLLRECGIEVRSGVLSLGPVVDDASPRSFESLGRVREDSPLRALDAKLEKEMVAAVDAAKRDGDTLGGSILVGARGVPAGLGSYGSWDRKLDARIGAALLSIPAVKAVELGSSVEASRGPGSRAHDEIERDADGNLRRRTNRAGGLEAGVTNGEDVIAVVTMKPLSTLAKGLDSVDLATGENARAAYERSDVTAVPACGVIAEAMLAFVLADALLENRPAATAWTTSAPASPRTASAVRAPRCSGSLGPLVVGDGRPARGRQVHRGAPAGRPARGRRPGHRRRRRGDGRQADRRDLRRRRRAGLPRARARRGATALAEHDGVLALGGGAVIDPDVARRWRRMRSPAGRWSSSTSRSPPPPDGSAST